jgi:hypothetical protein
MSSERAGAKKKASDFEIVSNGSHALGKKSGVSMPE